MDEQTAFEKYEAYQHLCFEEVQILRNYACRQLNGGTPNRDFYQAVYDDCNNLYLVIEWRKKNQHCAIAQKEEKVVGNKIEKMCRSPFFIFDDFLYKKCYCVF